MVRYSGIALDLVLDFVLVWALAWCASACSDTKKADDESAATPPVAQGPTCEQQVTALADYLADLGRARTAIAADPLAVRTDAATTHETAVVLSDSAGTAPVPDGFVVEVTADRTYMNGKEQGPYAMGAALSDQFYNLACGAESAKQPRDIVLVAAPDAPWEKVERIIRDADEAGVARILLGFAVPSGVAAPAGSKMAEVTQIDPLAEFAPCPGLFEAFADETGASDGAVTAALGTCQCAVPVDRVRAYAYDRIGIGERAGRIPASIALSFIDSGAGPESARKVISLAPDVPWSKAHETVLAAIRAGGALVTAVDGEKVEDKRLAVQTARGPEHCKTLPARGVLGALQMMKGGAFASLTGVGDFSSGLDDTNVYGGLLGNEVGELSGGFGYALKGTGAGGGGTGWGTIGTGNYGVIGHGGGTGAGYGTGYGRGGMSGRTSKSAKVRIGTASVQGGLDKNIIRRYVRRKLPRVKYCYEKLLPNQPKVAGKLVSKFVIGANGEVTKSEASGINEQVDECVAAVIKTISFPKPKGGAQVVVTYPFSFQPPPSP